jgi:hypothetical protein
MILIIIFKKTGGHSNTAQRPAGRVRRAQQGIISLFRYFIFAQELAVVKQSTAASKRAQSLEFQVRFYSPLFKYII